MAYLMRLTGDAQLSLDLIQESFARYLARYGRGGGNRALLFTIARNAALDALRRHREESSADGESQAPGPDPEYQCIAKEAFDRMFAAIRRLTPSERELISLVATEAFSYKAIGKLLGISEGNVKIRVHRARLRLRSILADGDE
jgi:RNA polymerase sigma-70 factor (ECF subfamily)